MQRRALLRGLIGAGAVLAVPAVARGWSVRAPAAPADPTTPAPPTTSDDEGDAPAPQEPTLPPATAAQWQLVAPLIPGANLGCGWRVHSLSALAEGALVLALAHRSGARAAVHVHRRRGAARGIAHTAELDLFLMNGGDGSVPTGEKVGRAVKTVALRIAAREQRIGRLVRLPRGLLSHAARLQRFGAPEALA